MADGSEIKDDASYQVTFWQGTVNEKYYDAASVKAVEGKFEDLLSDYLKEKGTIAPEDTDRITLQWGKQEKLSGFFVVKEECTNVL
jgi:hypothetical protein